jgi:hypothetical protein
MSQRSRSNPWYREPFSLDERGAECLRGHVFALKCIPSWNPYGITLLPAARIWYVPRGSRRYPMGFEVSNAWRDFVHRLARGE